MQSKALQWYQKLGFPKAYDEMFRALINQADLSQISEDDPVGYLVKKEDYGLNLVYFLEHCEEMYQAFSRRGIPESIFYDCAKGLVSEAQICMETFGTIGVYEAAWIYSVVNLQNVIRIGRLNFGMDIAGDWCSGGPIQNGDKILLVHIPAGGKLSVDECYQSMRDAERFFLTYYPEYHFKCFVCGSWMLDEELDAFLGKESNIRGFRKLFTPYMTKESDSAIKFVFGRTVTRENIQAFVPKTGLQLKLQKHIVAGGKLHATYGIRERGLEEVPAIDCHYHQLQWFSTDLQDYPYPQDCADTGDVMQGVQSYMEKSNLKAVNILCMPNMPQAFPARDITQNILGGIVKCENKHAYAYGGLVYPQFPIKGDCNFKKQAETLMAIGFDGIKLIETKPNAHNLVGLPICDPAYDEFFQYLEEERIPILWHANDPVFLWKQDDYYAKQCAPFEQIQSEVLSVLNRHPHLCVVLAHFFFMAWDIKGLSNILDTYSNVAIDITPAEEELGFLSENYEESRLFFRRYADRILFGTDNKNVFKPEFKDNKVTMLRRYLRTNDTFSGLAYKLHGVGLEREPFEKIMYRNFEKRNGAIPKAINQEVFADYIRAMLPHLPKGQTKEMIAEYLKEMGM